MDPTRPVAFMHVPKTGGTSFMAALSRTLQRDLTGGFDRVLFDGFSEFDSLQDSLRSQIFESPAALPSGNLVAGHFSYATLRYRRSAQLVTVLREPVSRLLSHWLYWRAQDDRALSVWGGWARRVRQSHRPLVDFLREPTLAPLLDNLAARMLLWPHRLIANNRFIERRHGSRLLAEARQRLADFAFVDVLEDPSYACRLQEWLGRPFAMERVNETASMPEGLRGSLAEELTPEALDLLEARSWLDAELWRDVVEGSLPGCNAEQLRARTLLHNTARYASLMAG
jgi:hypothetical protein